MRVVFWMVISALLFAVAVFALTEVVLWYFPIWLQNNPLNG